MNLRVYYDGGIDPVLDKALEGFLLGYGLRRWASGINLGTNERDLAFDDKEKSQ